MLAQNDRIVVSHQVPVAIALPWFRHDGPHPVLGRHPVGPALEEVVDILPAGAQILLDLKCDRGGEAARLVRRILGFGLDPARVHISSRNWRSMEPLTRAGFRTWRSVAHPLSLRVLLESRARPGYAVTVRHPMLTRGTIERLQRLGRVMAWTVNDPVVANRLVDAGVDGVTSDRAEVFTAMGAQQAVAGSAAGETVGPLLETEPLLKIERRSEAAGAFDRGRLAG